MLTKKIPFIIVSLIAISCNGQKKNSDKKIYDAVKAYLDTSVSDNCGKNNDFTILQISNLTPMVDSNLYFSFLKNALEKISRFSKGDEGSLNFNLRIIDKDQATEKISRDSSKTLREKTINRYSKRTAIKNDLINRLKNIEKLKQAGKIDSTTVSGYIVRLRCDSGVPLNVFLDTNLSIIDNRWLRLRDYYIDSF